MSGETRGLMFDSPFGEFMRYTRGVIEHFRTPQGEEAAHRKARKERARMLTRQREEELRAQRLSQKNAG